MHILLWTVLFILTPLNCAIQFPRFNKDSINLNDLIETMLQEDRDKPYFCDIQVDYMKKHGSKFLYTRWNKDEPFSDTIAAFFRIYDHFINGVALENPFEFYLNAIYDYGPFAALRQTMEAQRHPWFHDGTNPQSKAYVIQKLNEVWNIPHTNKHNLITTGFKHIFFGEKRSSTENNFKKEYGGMHCWLTFDLMEKDNKIVYEHLKRKQFDVVADVKFYYNQRVGNRQHVFYDKYWKNSHTMLMNTSPQFEFTLYTTIALLYGNERTVNGDIVVPITIDDCRINMNMYYAQLNGNKYISSVYPVNIGEEDGQCQINYIQRHTNQCCDKPGHWHPFKYPPKKTRTT